MKRLWPALKWGLASFAGLLLFGFFVLLIWRYNSSEDAVTRGLATAEPYLAIWRYSAMALLIVAWAPIARWITRRSPSEVRDELVKQRWRVALWLVVLELILVQNVIGDTLGILIRLVNNS